MAARVLLSLTYAAFSQNLFFSALTVPVWTGHPLRIPYTSILAAMAAADTRLAELKKKAGVNTLHTILDGPVADADSQPNFAHQRRQAPATQQNPTTASKEKAPAKP